MAARRHLLALAAAAALAACLQDDGTRFNPIEAVTPTWDEDSQRQQGMEADAEIQKRVSVIHDPVVAGFINDLGQEIVRKIEPQPFIYRFRVIADPTLNAFALPGGYIYFHSGTLLAASSLDELAGVMGHEIAHVKARHHLRMQQKAQLPNILAGIAGMAAAVATQEPGALVVSQAVNVAVQLRFSREFETEADQLGGIFMTRAGYDPAGIARFFERILEEHKRHPSQVPPYLFSHPAVEDRIAAVRQAAEELHPTDLPSAGLAEALPAAQTRLAMLAEARRVSLPSYYPPPDRARTDPALDEARRHRESGDLDAALLTLARAEATEVNDPRVSFEIGELLFEQGRFTDAVAAYRRTVRLDPSRAMVFYKLGLAHKQVGDRHRAVYAFEQAMLRAGDAGVVRRRAAWEVEKLTFSIVREAGFADGVPRSRADTPAGTTRVDFRGGVRRMAWWAQLGPHFVPYTEKIRVRWIDPSGAVVQEQPVKRLQKPFVGSLLDFGDAGAAPTGLWTAEARLDDDVIDRRSVEVKAP